jgi:PAS domain S-box-containing protein
MFGWTAAEVVGCANPIVPAARRVEYARTIRDFGERGTGPSVIERSALCKDGTVIDVSLSTAPMRHADGTIGGVALITDITTRRRAEVALDEARRQTDLLLASTGEGVYAVDASGLTTFVNPAAARLLHSTPERLLGREMHALIHHSHADGTRFDPDESPINASIRDGTVHRVDSEVFWREDGTSFPVEYVSTPLAEDGRIIGAVVAFQDITQRRQLELQLRQGQKMEAIGRLAGGVAHDFNNLLTVITGYTVMLLTELPPEDPVLQDLREIQAASERGAGLTRQLLAFSRQQVLQPRVVDLKRVIGGMEKMLRRLIGEDIEFQIDAEGEPLYARADSGQIEQVLMNLVVNARDAMPTGGLLSMQLARARLTERDREQHSYVVPGEYACVSVRDTGCGMDNATQSRIFEPFFTTKESAKGTGLGLATVYGIVKQSGGYIWADSAPGQGTTFRVYLPEVHEEAAATVPAPAEELANGEAGATVLLVEDEDALRAVIERILRKRGYVVLAAASGAAALALVEQHAGPIDLLVTDVVMPKMSGQELAERLVQARGDLPVLFMSGYSLEAVAKHGVLRAGARLLKKPFTPQDLALVTGEVLSAHAGLVRTSELRAVRAAVD